MCHLDGHGLRFVFSVSLKYHFGSFLVKRFNYNRLLTSQHDTDKEKKDENINFLMLFFGLVPLHVDVKLSLGLSGTHANLWYVTMRRKVLGGDGGPAF